jgi:hypothetical protein
MRRAGIAVLLLLAAALTGGGCGDGSLSAGDLRTQASAICTRAGSATGRIAMPSSTDEGGRFLRTGVAEMRPALARLKTLKPPSDLRGSYDHALSARGQELAVIAQRATAIAHGKDTIATFRELQAALEPLTRIEDAAWRALEIPACLPR